MIQVALILGALAALLFGMTALLHGAKESGREQCKAEQAEAIRIEELRKRERAAGAARGFEADRSAISARKREQAPEVARAAAAPDMAGTCLSDDSVRIVNGRIGEHANTGESGSAMPAPAASAGR